MLFRSEEGREEGWSAATNHYEQIIIQEKHKAEQAIVAQKILMLRKFLERGVPSDDIEEMLEIDNDTLNYFIAQIKKEDGDNYRYFVNWGS